MKAATAILVALAAIVVGIGIGLLGKDDGPMKLVSVCTGEGTQTVRCTWIPED